MGNGSLKLQLTSLIDRADKKNSGPVIKSVWASKPKKKDFSFAKEVDL